MTRSPISTHTTGAKVLTATRSVMTGPWKKTKRRMTKSGHRAQRTEFPFLRKIEALGKSGPVILRGQPTAGRIMVSAGSTPRGQSVLQSPAVVAEPRVRGLQQLVFQTELEIAINLSRIRVFPGRESACRSTVAALHGRFPCPWPLPLDFFVQIRADIFFCSHSYPSKSLHRR